MENLNDIKKELIEGTLREGDTIQIKPRLQHGKNILKIFLDFF